MKYRKVTAIIRRDALEEVEKKLIEIGVKGISVSKIKGFGEYTDFYSRDWLVSHMRVEIFTHETKTDSIVQSIMDTAHLGLQGDGIIAVLPVEKLYRIRTRSEVAISEIQ